MNLKRHAINPDEPWKTRCGLTKAYITNMYGGEVTCKRCLHHIQWEKENKGA